MLRQWLVEIIADVPLRAEPVCDQAHELPLRADALEEHGRLAFEDVDRVDARAAGRGVVRRHQRAHEVQIQHPVQVAVEVVAWH
jgi:hypothetical protein